MPNQIINCNETDLEAILVLYNHARKLQTERGTVVWPQFDPSLVPLEISEKRQWKIEMNGDIACNWAVTYDDKAIWEEKDQDDAIYLHRICTNGLYRGQRFITDIVAWAITHAKLEGRKYVRLDTLGINQKLITHYSEAGFTYLGVVKLSDPSSLPLHYQREPNCLLFELEV